MSGTETIRKRNRRNGVLFVSQYFYPDAGATAQVLTELAEDLIGHGRTVEVVTGQPGYSSDRNAKVFSKENYKGIRIHRIPYIRTAKNKALTRAIRECSFFLSLFLNLMYRALFRRRCKT